MSGTSLDGIDMAACIFHKDMHGWAFEIVQAVTYPYSDEWKNKIGELSKTDGLNFCKIHIEYGNLLGELALDFMGKSGFKPAFIASHGHTVFHQPEKGFTFQIGAGSSIAAISGIPVVCDFRTTDISLGGQGAPLVPIGDKLLFPQYDFCINLGGFSNISYDQNGKRLAFDICPVNTVLNDLAERLGSEYDQDGRIAREGVIAHELLSSLDNLPFYSSLPPKSLGREWLKTSFYPVFNSFNISEKDMMRTMVEHISNQISQILNTFPGNKNVLITGGGAHNQFLVERISANTLHNIQLPDKLLIDYKEALIFAFLGLLRFRNEINILSSVTGSRKDHSAGCIYQ